MKKMAKYSVLRYSPRQEVGEFINLGVLIVDEENGNKDFVFSRKRKRIEAFDDEVKYSSIMHFLISIQNDIKNKNDQNFSINRYIEYYINAFHFDEPRMLYYDSFDQVVEELRRVYLWFDYDPETRMSKSESVKFFKNAILSEGMKASSGRSDIGEFEDQIHYDIQTDQYNIVLFDVNEKNITSQINSAKLWSWNSKHHNPERDTLFVLNTNGLREEKYRVIKRVLEDSNAEVLCFEDALKKLTKATRNA